MESIKWPISLYSGVDLDILFTNQIKIILKENKDNLKKHFIINQFLMKKHILLIIKICDDLNLRYIT